MPVTVPFSANILFTWDRGDPLTFLLILSGDVPSSVFDQTVAAPVGARFKFFIQQDAVGGRNFSWPAICVGSPPISKAPNMTTVMEFVLLPGPILKAAGLPHYV